jgi:hypothetical protein
VEVFLAEKDKWHKKIREKLGKEENVIETINRG